MTALPQCGLDDAPPVLVSPSGRNGGNAGREMEGLSVSSRELAPRHVRRHLSRGIRGRGGDEARPSRARARPTTAGRRQARQRLLGILVNDDRWNMRIPSRN